MSGFEQIILTLLWFLLSLLLFGSLMGLIGYLNDKNKDE